MEYIYLSFATETRNGVMLVHGTETDIAFFLRAVVIVGLKVKQINHDDYLGFNGRGAEHKATTNDYINMLYKTSDGRPL